LIPAELGPKVHETLRHYFRDDPSIEVVVEHRHGERRSQPERRVATSDVTPAQARPERRRIRSLTGRRFGDRRATAVPVDASTLPRKARRYFDRIVFVEQLGQSVEHVEDLDTARLVARIQGGESDRFADLYMRYFDRLYSYFSLVLRRPHEAEDATQQVFLRVLEALPGYEFRGAPFRAWLFTIARHAALRQLEKERRVAVTDPAAISRHRDASSDDERSLSTLEWVSDRELLMLIARLPVAQRQVLVLRYMLDLTRAEVAEVIGRSPTDVRNLQYRALRFLRERLTAIGRAPEHGQDVRMRRWPKPAHVLRRRKFALMSR
jgi:RNA polymerase sigma-70 factor (ECF subfamily)